MHASAIQRRLPVAGLAAVALTIALACDREPTAPGPGQAVRHSGALAVAFDPGINIAHVLDSFAIGGVYTILPISGYPRNVQPVPFGPIQLVYARSPEADVYASSILRHPTGIDLPAALPVRVLAEGAVTSTFTDAFKIRIVPTT